MTDHSLDVFGKDGFRVVLIFVLIIVQPFGTSYDHVPFINKYLLRASIVIVCSNADVSVYALSGLYRHALMGASFASTARG